ncbi:MAG: ADP-ribosylglycohydrolase family protein [Candidatus Acetothermia bacterium]
MDRKRLYESAAGCLAGVAIGDAMGLPTQFMTPEGIRSEFGRIVDFEAPPDWHPYGDSPAGSVTDDTEQTLALADAFISKGRDLTAAEVGRALLDWARGRDLLGTDEIGPSTGRALRQIAEGKGPEKTGLRGTTNGASMRISPAGLINPLEGEGKREELRRTVRTVCTPTHNTPVAIGGATAVATAIAEGLSGSSDIGEIMDSAKRSAELAFGEAEESLPEVSEVNEDEKMEVLLGRVSPSLSSRVDLALDLVGEVKDDELPGELYRVVGTGVDTIEAVPAALALVKGSEGDPIRAVRYAASAGGDTDTVGAIAGGIAGSYAGIEAFPNSFLNQIEEVNGLRIERYAEELIKLVDTER